MKSAFFAILLSACVAFSLADCSAPNDLKVDCGFPDITESQCRARECCYSPSSIHGIAWCFIPLLVGKKNSAAEYFNRDIFEFDSWRVSDPFRDELFPYQNSVFPDLTDRTKPYAPLLTSDFIETEHDFKVLADLPGVRLEDIDVSIEGNILVMKAERKYTHKTGSDKYHSLERSYGTVQRSIRFPKTADAANAITRYKDGVLSVTFPKLGRLTPASTKLKIYSE